AAANPRPPLEVDAISPGREANNGDGPALARLRRVMLDAMGAADDPSWVAPMVAAWPDRRAAGDWWAVVVDGGDGRPVASAMAAAFDAPPAPGRARGRVAQVGSVATDDRWRRRGAA